MHEGQILELLKTDPAAAQRELFELEQARVNVREEYERGKQRAAEYNEANKLSRLKFSFF
jgi:hypothetical protein